MNAQQVALIGDESADHSELQKHCTTQLLEVSNNEMNVAYSNWMEMLNEMEMQAADTGLDLKGVKLWMNVFWNADGSIQKILYYPKPNSKNMDFTSITTFLEDFSKEYVLKLDSDVCFSHYGSATFPVYRKIATNNEK